MKNDHLAIYGGTPVRSNPFPLWPFFDEDEIAAVVSVLRSGKVNYWTGDIVTMPDGTKVRGQNGIFEYKFAHFIGTKYAIALANGSLALELCLYALGIGNNDEVIVPNRTFIASASSCIMRGAIPVFADIDPNTQNISLSTIKAVFTKNTKAIICVHLAGLACEMDEIIEFAEKNNIKVIEDCAQCLGGKYKNKMLGSIGHMAAFSFCQDKIMTTGGEGGMITTNDPNLYMRAWAYKDHGKDFHHYNLPLNHPLSEKEKEDSTFYTSIGTNWRMTEIQAIIGIKQLEKVPEWIIKRRRYAKIYNASFSQINGLIVPTYSNYIYHAYYKYYAFLDIDKLKEGWNKNRVIEAISAEGVICQQGSTWGVGLEKAWEKITCLISGKTRNLKLKKHLPYDYIVGSRVLMFQVHPTLNDTDIEDTISAVRKVLSVAIK